VENTARSLGLLVCLIDSQGRVDGESDGFALLMQHAVDGIIWCPLGPHPPATLNRLDRPIVLIDRPGLRYAVVHSNYLMGGELLARYALRMGHRRVGLLSGPRNLQSACQRRDGFVNAAPSEIEIAWEVNVGFDGVLTAEATQALRNRRKATLIVAGNNHIPPSANRHRTQHQSSGPQGEAGTGLVNNPVPDAVQPPRHRIPH